MVNNPPPFGAVNAAGNSALLLVVTPFEENAKRVESHLRNAGHKMRAVWIAELAELEQHLQKSQPDLLLASDHSSSVPLRNIIESCRRFAPSLPILVLAPRLGAEGTLAAVAAGASDLVADGDAESLAHLERVYVRELLAYRNLRELARTHALLTDYEARYAKLVAGTGDAVAHIYEGIISQVNPAFATLLGYEDVEALAGMPLMDVVAPDSQASAREHLKQLNSGRADGKLMDCALLCRNGGTAAVSAQMTRGEAEGERFVEMLIRATAAQPRPSSAPSGRMDFYADLEAPSEIGQPRAALFFVLDQFGGLEERIGCLDAELVAVQTGELLRKLMQPGDSLYRFSTQEFAALMSRPDALEFEKLAENWVREVGATVFSARDHDAQITLSITLYPLGGSETTTQICRDLIREARQLSTMGGNRFALLGSTARANAEEREIQRKSDAIRKALEENRFKLAYQTIASLEGDIRQHFDVLLRMIDEEGAELHARDFLPAAEKAGLMRSIDRWVVSRAIKVLANRETRKDSSMLFLKLSEETLKDAEGFVAWFLETLKGRRLGEDELCFEMAEVVLQNHIRKAKLLTKLLRDTGASVAIEHFGIGSSSAQLIEHLPINFLKFHRRYTHDFTDKEIQRKMSDLMEMAKQRQIKTIVSHVEDANVMARMWQMGVNYIQGYHIQEPEVVLIT